VLYRRFWLPVIIIGCSLLSTTAVFTALWLAGVDLNITALMGMTMIIGIGTEMAIFYVSEFEELCHTMPPVVATREASRNRLRPITMTTLAAILTLLPLALAIGQGSGIQQPLAIAIIAGLLLQYPLVLLAMPILVRLTLPIPTMILPFQNRNLHDEARTDDCHLGADILRGGGCPAGASLPHRSYDLRSGRRGMGLCPRRSRRLPPLHCAVDLGHRHRHQT
jgi:hypothetical protein